MDTFNATFAEGLIDIARHVIRRIMNPGFLRYTACYDVAGNMTKCVKPLRH